VKIPALAILALALAASPSTDYSQPYRPQVHFSPQRNWTNDPNGLVYFHGEYHLFFQFNPFGDQWGHMSWGHAVSPDLLHWRELPVAIPEKDGEMVFTGSVVIDSDNASGFCVVKPCLVAVYTGHRTNPEARQTQNLAYSNDDGRTWTRYEKNPVIDLHMADFRDPSVDWDDTMRAWRMAVSLPKEHKVRFYSSPDLKKWTQLSDFGPAGDIDGDWECPDLLQIPAEKGNEKIWALKVGLNPGAPQGGSGEQYFLGDFDGKRFVHSNAAGGRPDVGPRWTNYGKDDYCAISFNGLAADERPILMGWMNNWQYAAKLRTSPWRGQMSIPRRLSFLHDDAGLSLRQEPVTAALRGPLETVLLAQEGKSTGSKLDIPPRRAPFELHLKFERAEEKTFGVRLYSDDQHWTEIGFDVIHGYFYMNRTKSGNVTIPDFPGKTVAPLALARPYDLTLIVDRSSIEAFAQDGTIAMTDLIFPDSDENKIVLFSYSGKPITATGELWNLKSIWK
jgi:fructan beta-fructosidase